MSTPAPRLDDLRIERSSSTDSARKAVPVVIVILALAVVAAGVAWWVLRPKAIEVRTAAARDAAPGAGRTVLNASGYVTARREATVSSKITGKVTEVLIEEGVKVTEGQVLARLDDTNGQASLHLASAQVEAAKAALEETRVRLREAEQEWQRQKALITATVATQSDYDHAEAAFTAHYGAEKAKQLLALFADRTKLETVGVHEFVAHFVK